jgi:hypothetical protein
VLPEGLRGKCKCRGRSHGQVNLLSHFGAQEDREYYHGKPRAQAILKSSGKTGRGDLLVTSTSGRGHPAIRKVALENSELLAGSPSGIERCGGIDLVEDGLPSR